MNLPGLGTLELTKLPAKRDFKRNKINAPEYHIKFYDNEFDNQANLYFVEYLTSKHKLSVKKAENLIGKYSLDILNNIANYGSASIINLGTFSRKNDKLIFEFSQVLTEIINQSYPDYPLLHIKRTEKKNTPPTINLTNSSKETKESHWILPFFVLTATSIIIICMIYCFSNLFNDNNSGNLKNNISDTMHTAVIDTGNTSFTDDSSETTAQAQNQTQNAQKDTNISITSNEDTAMQEFPVEENDSGSMIKTDESLPADSVYTVDKSSSAGTGEPVIKKITLEELISMAPELRKKYEKSCIIITGSFIKKYNAKRMVRRLVLEGFTPYSERYGRFHRTGVIFDCDKRPLRVFLNELRQTIDKESWVLKWK